MESTAPRPASTRGGPDFATQARWSRQECNVTIVLAGGAGLGTSMAGINHFTTERTPQETAPWSARECRHKPQSLTGCAIIWTAFLCSLVALPMGAAGLFAVQKGVVMGMVVDPSQAPISGASVTLAAADGSRQSAVTSRGGRYTFAAVEPGTYTVSAEADGFHPATQTAVLVRGGSSTTVDFHLIAAASAGPGQPNASLPPPDYYDDTALKASAVKSTIDAAGYSSQAQSPQRLISEGPSLSGSAPGTPARVPGSLGTPSTERELQEALRNHPDSFEANHQLGEFYLSASNFKTGITYLEKARELKPEDDGNEYDLAVADLDVKSPGPARSLVQDLLRRKDSAELHHLLGEANEALGDPASATKEYEHAARMDPNEKTLFDWGNELLVHDSLDPAIEVFKRGVTQYPDSQRMYIGLGIAYYSRNLYNEAIEAICHASDMTPSDPRPYLFLGKMYNVQVENAGEVPKYMKRFTETNPDNALAYYYYALSSWKGAGGGHPVEHLADVEALLRKSILLDPGLADAHLQLGALLHDQNRDREAIAEFQAAVQLKPDDPDAHYRLAQAYLRAGDKERGQEEMLLYQKLRK